MAFQEKILGQAKPTAAGATVTLVQAAGTLSTRAKIIKTVTVCNVSAAAASYRLYAASGVPFSHRNSLVAGATLTAGRTEIYNGNYCLNASARFGARTSTASAICFTCFGAEVS